VTVQLTFKLKFKCRIFVIRTLLLIVHKYSLVLTQATFEYCKYLRNN